MPIATETPKASTIELVVTMVDQPASTPINCDSATPSRIPATPPVSEMIVVSIRNWRTTSRCRAPMARRTPISRVRSRTLASMMFMIPMPPTSSEIDAIATITISKMRCVRRCSASSSAGETIVKSPASRCETLSSPRSSAAADVTPSLDLSCR